MKYASRLQKKSCPQLVAGRDVNWIFCSINLASINVVPGRLHDCALFSASVSLLSFFQTVFPPPSSLDSEPLNSLSPCPCLSPSLSWLGFQQDGGRSPLYALVCIVVNTWGYT